MPRGRETSALLPPLPVTAPRSDGEHRGLVRPGSRDGLTGGAGGRSQGRAGSFSAPWFVFPAHFLFIALV
jgi:hypothetical protein